jgi:hypothetical protein
VVAVSAARKAHKATLLAWVHNSSLSREAAKLSGDAPAAAIGAASFYGTPDDPPGRSWECCYTLIGAAEITLVLNDPADITNAQIASLRAQKTSVLADAQLKVNDIERQIQMLLAINNEATP